MSKYTCLVKYNSIGRASVRYFERKRLELDKHIEKIRILRDENEGLFDYYEYIIVALQHGGTSTNERILLDAAYSNDVVGAVSTYIEKYNNGEIR